MDRRRFMLTSLTGVLTTTLTSEAQQAGKVYRIGVLSELLRRSDHENRWRDALSQYGYVEGRNLALTFAFAEERFERLQTLAAELVRSNVDLILTGSTRAAIVAKQTTTTIPIIVLSSDPVGAGLVLSLARPGGNVTGVFLPFADLSAKRIQLLKEIVPGLDSLAIVFNPGHAAAAADAKSTEAAARTLGVTPYAFELRTQADVESVVAAAVARHVRGLIVVQDPVAFRAAGKLAELTATHRLPASHAYREFVDAGGLFSYGVSMSGIYLMGAGYVDKVLKGAKPGDLPMQIPTKFEFIINLRTAKTLGVTIPPSLLRWRPA